MSEAIRMHMEIGSNRAYLVAIWALVVIMIRRYSQVFLVRLLVSRAGI